MRLCSLPLLLTIFSSNPSADSQLASGLPFRSYQGCTTSFLSGDFGVVLQHENGFLPSLQWDSSKVKNAAAGALHNLLVEHLGYTGKETILPTNDKVGVDRQRNAHVRCQQYASGLEIEGASMVIHINGSDGTIFAANGEFHSSDSIEIPPEEESLDCELAVEIALMELGITNGEWISDCEAAAVHGSDGKAYLAYKRLLGYYQTEGGATSLYQKDLLFASRTTGAILAVHPKVYGARSLRTYDALNQSVKSNERYLLYNMSVLMSNISERINTTDSAVNDAHNHAIAVYDFYMNVLGRDSIDGKGMTLESFVHFDKNLVNAFWDGARVIYGDGDGVKFTYFSKCLDVVAHECSHGVTDYTSNLVYKGLSGALNEAFSDIMGAAVERLYGTNKSTADVWTIAEDCDLDPSDGIGVRNMADPPMFNDPDHFADRYTSQNSNIDVHINSGIVNKAFYLMVDGGTHDKSGIQVPALDPDFDNSIRAGALIFYEANAMCLTQSSDFFAARNCTLMFAAPNHIETVSRAWDAVGVVFSSLSVQVKSDAFSLKLGDEKYFILDQTVSAGSTVTCTLQGQGDFDLYVKLGYFPLEYVWDFDCEAATGNSVEQCTTGPATEDRTRVYVIVYAFLSSSNGTLECSVEVPLVPSARPTMKPSVNPTLKPAAKPTAKPAANPTAKPVAKPTAKPAAKPTAKTAAKPTAKPSAQTCKSGQERCKTTRDCCRKGPFKLTCVGSTPRKKRCRRCKKAKERCKRSSGCCGRLKCRRGQCGRR